MHSTTKMANLTKFRHQFGKYVYSKGMWQKWRICQNRQQLKLEGKRSLLESGKIGEYGENGKFAKIAGGEGGKCK